MPKPSRHLSILTEDDFCLCGWLLPHSVKPVKAAREPDDVAVPGICVRLTCPQCGDEHGFYSPAAALAAGFTIAEPSDADA